MRPATLQELDAIKHIAEDKLSVYKIRASPQDYNRILAIVMREIANGMELQIQSCLAEGDEFTDDSGKYSKLNGTIS
jgi:hypothetical protein